MQRPDNRTPDQLRPISFQANIAPHSTGSVLVSFGDTRVICSAMIEEKVPRWMHQQGIPGGWLTAEYTMLPYATQQRKQRDSARGKIDGRSSEIQRLIGRSLRAVTDLEKLGSRTIWIDCDVLQADGGTRTASITGAYVALSLAIEQLLAEGLLKENPLKKMLAAISCGIYRDTPILDLNYPEDRDASVDLNLVLTEDEQFVEIQASGEEATYSPKQLDAMLALGKKGIAELIQHQRDFLSQQHATNKTQGLQNLRDHFEKK